MRLPTNREILIILLCSVLATYSIITIIYALSPSWEYKVKGNSYSVSITSNGKYIVSCSNMGSVYLFHHTSPNPIISYNTSDSIDNVDISDDGHYIVAGGNYRLHLYNVSSNTLLWTYDAQNIINDLIISGDGNYIAMTDIDNMIYVFHRSSPIPLWNKTYEYIASIDISFDGALILTCGYEIALFNSSTSTPIWTYKPPMASYMEGSLTSNGKYACVGTESSTALSAIYTFRTNSSYPIWNYTSTEDITSIKFSADGNYIVAGDFEGTLRLFNRHSAMPIFSYKMESKVEKLCISNYGDYFAAGLYSQIYFFKRGDSFPVWSYSTNDYIFSMDMSADGNYLCASIIYGTILLIQTSAPYIFGDKTMIHGILWATLILFIFSLASIPIYRRNKKYQ
ncbi:MAG: WD40 repeat domain-containing protein [Promethearchaeota archaeon]